MKAFYFNSTVYGWKGELEVEVEALGNVTLTIGYSNGLPNRARQFNLQYDVNSEIWRGVKEGQRRQEGTRDIEWGRGREKERMGWSDIEKGVGRDGEKERGRERKRWEGVI